MKEKLNKSSINNILDELYENSYSIENTKNNVNNKEIIFYGAGNLGKLAIKLFRNINIYPKYIVDKNDEIIGKDIDGVKIIHPDDISDYDKENSVFAVCIVTVPFNSIRNYLFDIGCKYIYPFYDIAQLYEDIGMNNGWSINDISKLSKKDIEYVYYKLDEKSKYHYLKWLYWRISRKEIDYSIDIDIENKFFIDEIKDILKSNENYIDIGAYEGETIKKFISNVNGKFETILAFEPYEKSYKTLVQNINRMSKNCSGNIILSKEAVGNYSGKGYITENLGMANKISFQNNKLYNKEVEISRLDDLKFKSKPTFIKIHSECMEYDILKGGINTIIKYRPILVMTTYHNEDGIYKIPKFLMKNISEYSFYYRLHGYCGTQSVLYCIPKERQWRKSIDES